MEEDGYIKVSSNPKKGTTFSLFFARNPKKSNQRPANPVLS
jgi:hypothetical protein